MSEAAQTLPLLVLLVGVAIAAAILIKSGLESVGIPALVGYLLLGLLVKLIDTQFGFLDQQAREIFDFLAQLGIISLLFRVGLESNLSELVRQLPSASLVWVGNVLVSGGLGFATSYWLLRLALIPSLFVAIAMTATSVGVSIGVWQDQEATHTKTGELLLDVAEMDDISSVVLMALLFAVAPVIRDSGTASLLPVIAKTTATFFFKAIVFGAFCFFFSRYIEKKLTNFFRQIESPPDPMLEVVGIGFVIAALAGLLGFSVAIGAFFAGLVFSRDPEAVKLDASFESIYELLTPFFFIGIGLTIEPSALGRGLGMGGILLVAAFLGKFLGAGGTALLNTNSRGAALLGVSLVPRAEITLIVMERGLSLGNWAVPPQLFAAMVVVSAATSMIIPIVLHSLLKRYSQTQEKNYE